MIVVQALLVLVGIIGTVAAIKDHDALLLAIKDQSAARAALRGMCNKGAVAIGAALVFFWLL